MKKFIVILLSVLLTCTALTPCSIGSRVIKKVPKSSQKKLQKNYLFGEEREDILDLIKYRAANRAIIDATKREPDSIHAEELPETPDFRKIWILHISQEMYSILQLSEAIADYEKHKKKDTLYKTRKIGNRRDR